MTYLTIPQLAKKLTCNPDKVYSWIHRKNNPLPAYRSSERGLLIIEEEFFEWLKQYQVKPERIEKLV
ncbi:MAG: helix-turn-helix domain-containing protein [Candidatus Hodarchaeales archaeon]|jgi:excisionase family DNA binding protein